MRQLRVLFPNKTLCEVRHILDNCLPFMIEDLSNADANYVLERMEGYANCVVTDNDTSIIAENTLEYNKALEEARKWRDNLSEADRKHFNLLISQNVCYAVA
jgi:hypothetical protein